MLVNLAKTNRLLPEAMLYGMSYAFLSTHARACYLAGSHGTQGWRLFFPYAMAVKTPSGTLLVLTLAVAAAVFARSPKPRPSSTRWSQSCPTRAGDESAADVRKLAASGALGGVGSDLRSCGHDASAGEGTLTRLTPLLVLMGIYTSVAINQNLNIGHRHMLPIYPPLYVICGLAARWLKGPLATPVGARAMLASLLRPLLGLVVLVGVGWVCWEVGRAFPFYIPFFNGLSGGQALGHTHLVDSSLDWGQVGRPLSHVAF